MKKLLTLTLSLLMAFSLCLTVSADNVIAKDGDGNEYTNLEEILRKSTGSPIKLIDNYTVRNDYLYTNVSNIDLDLNGFELNIGGNAISCRDNLTIRDTSDSQEGKITFSDFSGSSHYEHIGVSSGAKFTLESGQIVNKSNNDFASTTIRVNGPYNNDGTNGQVIINGGTIDNSQSTDACITSYRTGAIVTINGGTLKSKGNVLVKDTSYGDTEIKVNNGTFSSDVSAYLASDSTIVKYNNEYTVYSAKDTVSVNEETKALAGLSSTARFKLDAAGTANTIKDEGGNSVTVNSSTQLVLDAANISTLEDDKLNKIVEKTDTEISNLSLLPLNITLTAKTGDDTKTITDLGEGEAMPVTLYLSDDVVSSLSDKTIKVVRFHGDDVDALYATLNGKVLTFESGKFSTFVVCGITSSSGGNTDSDTNTNTNTPTKSYDAKDKNKDGVVSCEEEMDSANWIWSTTKNACVYKVTNTSSK